MSKSRSKQKKKAHSRASKAPLTPRGARSKSLLSPSAVEALIQRPSIGLAPGSERATLESIVAYLEARDFRNERAVEVAAAIASRIEDFAQAASIYERLLATGVQPSPACLAGYGGVLRRLDRLPEARLALEAALGIDPQNLVARTNYISLLGGLGLRSEQLAFATETARLFPEEAPVWHNLSETLYRLGRLAESRRAAEMAFKLDSRNPVIVARLARAESAVDNAERAMELFHRALELLPDGAHARRGNIRLNLAYEYLMQGRLAEGWEAYQGRFNTFSDIAWRGPIGGPPTWDGGPLTSGRLLVWGEQGLGDELLFASCFPDLRDQVPEVVLHCEPRLASIFERSFPTWTVVPRGAPLPPVEWQTPAGNLPRFFRRTIEAFEDRPAYIATCPVKVARFAERLRAYRGRALVGVCWRSGMVDGLRSRHYSEIHTWEALLRRSDLVVVNLQYSECEPELRVAEERFGAQIVRWPDLDLKNDLDDVFALICCLDIVVSVPTAVMMMAGAVGTDLLIVRTQSSRAWTDLGASRYPWFPRSAYVEHDEIRSPTFDILARRPALKGRGEEKGCPSEQAPSLAHPSR